MNLFAPKPPKAIAPPAKAPTPEADDDAIRSARKRQIALTRQRTGRLSTMLSDASGEKFG